MFKKKALTTAVQAAMVVSAAEAMRECIVVDADDLDSYHITNRGAIANYRPGDIPPPKNYKRRRV